jgi:hypothetical protein
LQLSLDQLVAAQRLRRWAARELVVLGLDLRRPLVVLLERLERRSIVVWRLGRSFLVLWRRLEQRRFEWVVLGRRLFGKRRG